MISGDMRSGTYFPDWIPSSTRFVSLLYGSNRYIATITRPASGSRYSIHSCVCRNPVTIVIQRPNSPATNPSTTPHTQASSSQRPSMYTLPTHFFTDSLIKFSMILPLLLFFFLCFNPESVEYFTPPHTHPQSAHSSHKPQSYHPNN